MKIDPSFGPESVAVIPLSWADTVKEYPGFWPVSMYKTPHCPVQRSPYHSEFGYCGGVYIFIGERIKHDLA